MDKISEIAAHIKQAKNGVSFITGAGASRTANIPTANQLVERIQKDYNHCLNGLSEAERQHYGKVMAQLTPADRVELVVPLLENSGINWGHIALAALIKKGHVSRVLTFNFDLVLEKAVALLGMQLPIYDFGGAPTSEINRIAQPSILHLHGQSHGLILLNTEEETKKHKGALQPVLKDTICNHVTIVIGYSGETDGALEVICDEFNSHNRLIWLGHSDTPPPRLRPLLNKNYADYIGNCDFDLTMIKIAQNLDIWPPVIIDNPIEHLLDELSDVQDYPADKDAEINVLESTRNRLEKHSQKWKTQIDPDNEAYTELMRGQITSSEKSDPIIRIEELSEGAKDALSWAYTQEGNTLSNEAKNLLGQKAYEKFTKCYQYYEQALTIKPDKNEALYNWGTTLMNEAITLSGQQAHDKFAESYNKFQEAHTIKRDKHKALTNWGTSLLYEADILSGDKKRMKVIEAIKKFKQALIIKPDQHQALSNLGLAIMAEAKFLSGKQANDKLEQAKQKFQKAKSIKGRGDYNLACILSRTNNIPEAIEELTECKNDDTLPNLKHLETDTDINPLRETKEFQELIASLKDKE